ncbi:MAG: hypothetical protein KDK78_10990 [Chlamydiia bacterium]|nr:hypothetical protein [Chlamydiia bacterium]
MNLSFIFGEPKVEPTSWEKIQQTTSEAVGPYVDYARTAAAPYVDSAKTKCQDAWDLAKEKSEEAGHAISYGWGVTLEAWKHREIIDPNHVLDDAICLGGSGLVAGMTGSRCISHFRKGNYAKAALFFPIAVASGALSIYTIHGIACQALQELQKRESEVVAPVKHWLWG